MLGMMSFPAMCHVSPGSGPPYYAFPLLAAEPGVVHAVFTRHGGVSAPPFNSLNVSTFVGDDPQAVRENRDRVMAALGRPRAGLVMAGLVHDIEVARVDASTGQALDGGGRYVPRVDALVTNDPAVALLVTAADCAQVFLLDPRRRAVGLAHAGWRGTAAGVLAATVAAMRAHFGSDPTDLRAAVGPCLGPCCARFSDPHHELPAWCAPFIHGHYVDLWAMNRNQLIEAGLHPERVAVAEVCTVCRRDLFFSHRGDAGRSGRFAAAIGVTE